MHTIEVHDCDSRSPSHHCSDPMTMVLDTIPIFPRLYMDGWRDGLNRLWRDGVTILPRPAKKIATAKNNCPVPALEKKKNTAPSRPVEKKKKPPRPSSEKKNNRPVLPRKKKKNAPSPMNSKIHRPEGGNWKQIPPPVSFSLFLVAHLYRIVV